MPSDHHSFEHSRRENIVDVLREKGESAGCLQATARRNIAASKEHASPRGGSKARQRVHCQGLSRAILAENRQQLAGASLEAKLVD